MRVDVVDTKGKKIGTIELAEEIFKVEVNPRLIAQVVRVYLSNQRQATVKVKTRGEVRGSRRKIWRQKGTGRARHGDKYAPIFVGGGRAHGPTGEQSYKLKLTKKMRQKAFLGALKDKFEKKQVVVVEGLEKLGAKTKKFAEVLAKVADYDKKKGLLLVLPTSVENVWRGVRNLPAVSLTQAGRLNTYELMKHHKIVFMKDSVEALKRRLRGGEKKTREVVQKERVKEPEKRTVKVSARVEKVIKAAGLSLEKAKKMSVEELKAVKGLGPKGVAEIKAIK